MQNADLHCHSSFSDGTLTPEAIIRRALANGVELLSLTDHDHLGGLSSAAAAACSLGLGFVPGVEISVSWQGQTVHIVGLGIDPTDPGLNRGLEKVRSGRNARASHMAQALEQAGIPGALEGALRYCANPALLGRAHFARFIVEQGFARDTAQVFERYLVPGKPGYVEHEWASLGDALDWIHNAGGVSVMAHPARYRVSPTVLMRLLSEFKAGGGRGIEVSTGAHDAEDIRRFARIAREEGFLASRASDFHGPGEGGTDLGGAPPLPEGLTPVWSALSDWR